MTMAHNVAGNPAEDMCMGIECASNNRQFEFYYCSDGNLQPDDPTRFDYATFTIMVDTPATGEIGRLWIVSDIDFSEPIPISTWPLLNEAESLSAHNTSANSAGPFSAITIDTALSDINFPTAQTISFPVAGTYFIAMNQKDATNSHLTNPLNIPTTGSNISGVNIFDGGTDFFLALGNTIVSSLIACIKVNAPISAGDPGANAISITNAPSSTGTDSMVTVLNIFPVPSSLISIMAAEEKEEKKEYEAFQRFIIRLRDEQKKNRRVIIQDSDLYEISDVNIEPEELVSFPGDKFKLSQKQLVSPSIVVEEKKEAVTRKSGFFSTSR